MEVRDALDAEAPAPGALSRLLLELATAPREPGHSAPGNELRAGMIIGDRFELVEPLGRGGFGVVFRARDLQLSRDVAIKALAPDPALAAKAAREGEVAAQLQHENVVRLYQHFPCESGTYLIFELLDGETLAARLRRGPIPLAEALRIAAEVTRALGHAHARKVLHRDLKPSNVFLTARGAVKVLDFGLAYFLGEGPARSGTPGYMAPEQLRGGSEDPRTDLYAVGVLLREMLTGRPPSTSRDALAGGGGRPRLPSRVADLLERTTAADPARRPGSAASLETELTALLRALEASRRRWGRAAIFLSMAAAGALVGVLLVWIIKDVRARPVVAVADLENTTGDADLQGLSGLLGTSLEQWTRLSVVPRQRLLSLAADPDRLDCDRARRAAQAAAAAAVLCARVGRDGTGYAITLEVLEPEEGRLVDRLQERTPTRQALVAAVDRLSARVRGVLFSPLPRPAPRPIGGTTSNNMEALAHYFRGVECADRPAHGQDCGVELRRALELDPEFGLAAYRLAIWLHWFGGRREEQQALLARAATNGAGLPDKEQALLRAWTLHLDGHDREAIDRFGEAARRWRDDPEPSYQAGDLLRHQDRLAEALPRFEQVLALQPDHEWALGGLVQCLGPLGREAELRRWLARWEADPRPGTRHALSLARGWLGDVPGAAAAAREALVLGGGPQAQEDLLAARVFAGELDAVEPDLRRLAASRSPARSMGYYGLAALHGYRGRPRAALAALDALAREVPEVARDAVFHTIRADLLLGSGDARAVWREVEAARAIDPRLAAEHAVSLAWLGDLEHARALEADLPAEGALAATTAALVRFRSGDAAGGLAELQRISATTPVFAWRVAPLYLYGALLAEAGRDAEAIEVLRRAQALYLPLAMWRSWAYPRSQLWLARSNEHLGRRVEARQELGRLLATWARAEEGTPELAAAHALAPRLATPPSVQRGER